MLGSNDNVFHASILCHAHPFIRVIQNRIELFGKCLIVRNRNLTTVHDPFTDPVDSLPFVSSCRNSIHTPVDEHAKAGIAPPFHAVLMRCVLPGLSETDLSKKSDCQKCKDDFLHTAEFRDFIGCN